MKSKRHLKEYRLYENVFIENDPPKSQRVLNSNLRTIVKTIGQDKHKVVDLYVSVRETDAYSSEQRTSDRHRDNSYRSHDRRSYESDRHTHNDNHRNRNRYDSAYNNRDSYSRNRRDFDMDDSRSEFRYRGGNGY